MNMHITRADLVIRDLLFDVGHGYKLLKYTIMNDLKQTVQSICTTLQGLGDEIVLHAKDREQQENRMLSSLDESLAKLRNSVNNLKNQTL